MEQSKIRKLLDKFESSLKHDYKKLFNQGGSISIKGVDFGTFKNRGTEVVYTPVQTNKTSILKSVEQLEEFISILIDNTMDYPDWLEEVDYEKLGGDDMDLSLKDIEIKY